MPGSVTKPPASLVIVPPEPPFRSMRFQGAEQGHNSILAARHALRPARRPDPRPGHPDAKQAAKIRVEFIRLIVLHVLPSEAVAERLQVDEAASEKIWPRSSYCNGK